MEYVKHELARGIDDWEQRLSTALVKSSPTDLVRSPRQPTAPTASNARQRTPRKIPSSRRANDHKITAVPPESSTTCPLCDDTGWKPVERRTAAAASFAATAGASSVGQQASRRREHPEALSALHVRQLHRVQRIARARRGAGAPHRRGVSGRQQRPVPRRAAWRRQDAPGGRRAEAGRSRRPARAGCSTTRATCCASSAAPTIRRFARRSSRCCGR